MNLLNKRTHSRVRLFLIIVNRHVIFIEGLLRFAVSGLTYR